MHFVGFHFTNQTWYWICYRLRSFIFAIVCMKSLKMYFRCLDVIELHKGQTTCVCHSCGHLQVSENKNTDINKCINNLKMATWAAVTCGWRLCNKIACTKPKCVNLSCDILIRLINARIVEHIITLYCGLKAWLIILPSLWNRVFLVKLTVAQLFKKFIAFYRTWMFVAEYTAARQMNPVNVLSWLLRSVLTISSHFTPK